ncbi:MBL fold metallo-hydrolase [Azorhizobium oxalatiphilum]|uniref:MBL fold metallo-hydrolase n=1 Tax=Azorhizobium oxalatiphilum TaxID=980631 RepID=A0A917BL57_9HYPH|nr:MBL fold metallo-hydrolase [Azorhizobium oxalatiphilum]GGF48576.1 MBL fold metallo-hydrolase [Azorhizobium oxalatiphilum]
MTAADIKRRTLLAAGLGAVAAPAILSGTRSAQAQATPAAKPADAPEINQFKLGSFKFTVVRDGLNTIEKPQGTFGTNQSVETVDALLKANFLPTDKFVNTYSPALIDTGSDVILVDTGFGAASKPRGTGRLLDGLKAAGYAPEDITVVALTHMHGDHIGGLMADGKPVFSKARYVAGKAEYDFWTSKDRAGTPAEGNAKAVAANVVPLAEKITFIGEGGQVAGGITAMMATGHTPGHMVFNVESGGKRLLLSGDTANHYILSLQRPDWEVRFDMDKAQAAATRKKVFDMVATDRIAFLGYHMPFPAVGFVEKQETGYRFVPKSYQFDL